MHRANNYVSIRIYTELFDSVYYGIKGIVLHFVLLYLANFTSNFIEWCIESFCVTGARDIIILICSKPCSTVR